LVHRGTQKKSLFESVEKLAIKMAPGFYSKEFVFKVWPRTYIHVYA
jgi:hypothetical protein